MSEFGSIIKKARESKTWSLGTAAAQLGCTKSHLWELEAGKSKNPTARLLIAMKNTYGMSAAILLALVELDNS